MNYNLYSIQDTLVGFNAPYLMVNDNVAKREYANFLKKTTNPTDMRLYKIATFDDTTGTIIPLPALEQLMGGGDNEGNI